MRINKFDYPREIHPHRPYRRIVINGVIVFYTDNVGFLTTDFVNACFLRFTGKDDCKIYDSNDKLIVHRPPIPRKTPRKLSMLASPWIVVN